METTKHCGSDVPDGVLLKNHAVHGDQGAFNLLVSRYRGLVWSVSLRCLGGNTSFAEDAVQAVFILLARKSESLVGRDNIAGWIHRTSTNVSRTLLRQERTRARRHELAALEPQEDPLQGEDHDVKAQRSALLHEQIAELPRRQGEVIVLHYFRNQACAAIGEQLGCSENAVRMMLTRARKELKKKLERKGVVLSLAALAALLEAEASAASAAEVSGFSVQVSGESEMARELASDVLREMGRRGRKKAVGVAAGVLLVAGGLGGSLILSDLSDMSDMSDGPTQWRVASVTGAVEGIEPGKLVCPGDVIRTGPGQEVELLSGDGDRLLLREEGELQHPTSNAQRPTSKSGEPGFRLQKGALVAELKRTVRFETEQGAVETAENGAEFWLLVAESTNAFTRVDVTAGVVEVFENVQEPSSPLKAVEGEAICMWEGIEPRVFASPRRELSPRYGGVFFREYADLYATRGFALNSLDFEDGAVLGRLGTDALEKQAARVPGITSRRTHSVVDGEPRAAVRIGSSGAGAAEFVIPLSAAPASGMVVEVVTFGASRGVEIGLVGFEEWCPERHPESVLPGRHRQDMGSKGLLETWRIACLHIGEDGGTPVYESRCCLGDQRSRVVWCWRPSGSPFGVAVLGLKRSRAISLCDVVAFELRAAAEAGQSEFGSSGHQ